MIINKRETNLLEVYEEFIKDEEIEYIKRQIEYRIVISKILKKNKNIHFQINHKDKPTNFFITFQIDKNNNIFDENIIIIIKPEHDYNDRAIRLLVYFGEKEICNLEEDNDIKGENIFKILHKEFDQISLHLADIFSAMKLKRKVIIKK